MKSSLKICTKRSTHLLCLLTLSSLLHYGCNLEEPEYRAGDHIGFDLTFSKDNLSEQYLTDTTVHLYIDGPEAESFAIQVSDETILVPRSEGRPELDTRYFDCEEDISESCQPQQEEVMVYPFARSFDVKSTGEVTIDFLVNGKRFLSKKVSLVNANDIKFDSELNEDGSQWVAVFGQHIMRVTPEINGEGIDFSEITDQSTLPENVQVYTSSNERELVVKVYPEEVGLISFDLELGGKLIPFRFQAVEANAYSQFEVVQQEVKEYRQEDDSVLLRSSSKIKAEFLNGDGNEETIHGAMATWTRKDTGESIFAAHVSYDYSETEQVPFTVTIGEMSKEIFIPMDPQSSIAKVMELGCDAQAGRQSSFMLLALLLLVLVSRRKQIA